MNSIETAKTKRRRDNQLSFASSRKSRGLLKYFSLLLAFLLIAAAGNVYGQRKNKKTAKTNQPTLVQQMEKAKQDVIHAAEEYKASLQKLLVYQEADVKSAADIVEKRKALFDQKIISKKDVDDSERLLATAQAKVAETRKQMGESDDLIAEARAAEQLAKMPPARVGTYQATAALIRYNGPAKWVLSDSAKVGSFFLSQFHHQMPVSAFGQTAVHNQLGFDHSNSMDVAVHPDSAEGQGLMAYLRSAGIPFIAFRHAIAGSATGAHIHIGYPSHRIR